MLPDERVAVVTEGHIGIGKFIVKSLCKEFDGEVYLAAKDEKKGLEAIVELRKIGLKPKFFALDIESNSSIEKFKEFIQLCHGGIDVLVNNAGISFKNNGPESFGNRAEQFVRFNFFGNLRICQSFQPIMKKHARIVNISSGHGLLHNINGKEPEATRLREQFASEELTVAGLTNLMNFFVKLAKEGTHYEAGFPNSAVGMSYIGLSALTCVLQRSFDKERPRDNIIVNSVHPGKLKPDMSNSDECADATLYLALLPYECKDPRGKFVWHNKRIVNWEDPFPEDLK